MAEDSTGNLWLATSNGVIHFNRGANKIMQYLHDPNDPGSLSFNEMDFVYIDKHGRLWVATKKGLNLFVPHTGTFQHITRCATHGEDIRDLFFLEIIEDREGNVWFGSDDGLFCLESGRQEKEIALTHYKNDPRDPHSLSINRARALYLDEDGMLWIGTEMGGINVFNKTNRNFDHYHIDDYNPLSLNNESIQTIVGDKQNNIWIGTWGGGVNITNKNSDFMLLYRNLPGAEQSLSFNQVSGFAEDDFHRIWVSTDGFGFNLFNDTTGKFQRFNTTNSIIKGDALPGIFKGDGNQIWVGSWEGGLIRYDCTNNTISYLMKSNSAIPDNTFYSIAQDSTGDLWLGSFRHGLVHYRMKEKTFAEYSTSNSTVATNEVSVVRIDRHGYVYIAAKSYLHIFNPAEKRFITNEYISPDTAHRGIDANIVYDIKIENDTCTWLASQNGLCRYNQKTGGRRWYFKADGLPTNTVKGVTIDRAGMLWVTTSAGICRFDARNNKIRKFTTSDGLQSNDFYKASVMTTSAGKILAGGSNGFNLISPDKYAENRSVPEVVITDFYIFNEKVKIGGRGSPLQKQISETRQMTLSYKHSVLTFYFAVMDFSNPDKNQYAYRMENFDKDWTYCGNKKEATYTNLDPGKYFFHVKGANNDGVWNEAGTTLELVITPPWWQTKWARAGFVLLIMLVLLWVYLYFRNKQEQKHLRELVASQKKVEDIMRSIDEAIFTINEDMSINPEHSKTAEKIFGTVEFEKQNLSALFNMDDTTRSALAKWLKLAFRQQCTVDGWAKAMRFNPIKEVVLRRESRIFLSINYQPIYENGALSRVMIIVNDITHQKKTEQDLARLNTEKELLSERVFGLVSNDYENVLTILDLGKSVIKTMEAINFDAIQGPLQELSRDLHTLKGSAGSMDFPSLSKCCDTLESALGSSFEKQGCLGADSRARINKALGALKVEMQAILELRISLYSGKEDKLSIDKADYAGFLEALKNDGFQSREEIIDRFRMLNALKFSEFCAEFSRMAADYSERFQKNIEPLQIETPDVRIERKVCKVLKGPITHLIRNALDHGIEEDAVREKSGKGPGRVSMALREKDEIIELEVADNGGGIDPEQVAASAIKKGFITPEQVQGLTDEEKRDLIFMNGFSTRDEASAISGRGVGMDAVKADIEKAGGDVKLVSRVGQGTHILVRVPRMAA
jgi:ligand-binding sensor domain-containing protein/HPt (histidine-containing phosphotransfer) domain-containing protein/PAS domain-containing protein